MPDSPNFIYARLGVPASGSSGAIFDPERKYVSSPMMPPLALAAVRLLAAMYTLVTLVVTIAWQAVNKGGVDSFFSYYTHLTYIGLCAYFFASGTQTLSYALRGAVQKSVYPLQSWWRPLQALHVALYASIVNMPLIVTVVFWALLTNASTFGTSFSAWNNISVHALNSVFALFEIICTNAPPSPWLTLVSNLAILAGYLCVAYITHATQGIYTYSFLDPGKQHGLVAAYIFGIALAECFVFVVVRYIILGRERWAVRRASGAGSSGVHNRDNSTTVLRMTERRRSIEVSTKDNKDDEDWEEVRVSEKAPPVEGVPDTTNVRSSDAV